MDETHSDALQPSPHSGVNGLGYRGRPAGDVEPTTAANDATGLGFAGRDAPDEYDGNRFSGAPSVEPDIQPKHDPNEPDLDPEDSPDTSPDEDRD
jgi:hypothetical protein